MKIGHLAHLVACSSQHAPPSSLTRAHIPLKTSCHPISASLPASTSLESAAPGPSSAGLHSPARQICSSMARLTGSAMPNARRRPSIFSASWVARHCASRASRGCVDCSGAASGAVSLPLVGAPTPRFRFVRSVSCTPGAEGAPGLALVCEGCAFAGTMRRDWERWLAGSEAAGFGIHGLYHFELVVATKEQYGVRDVSTGVMEMWNGGWRELGAAFCWNSSLQVVASEAALEALSS